MAIVLVIAYPWWRDRVEDSASWERLQTFIMALNAGDTALAVAQVDLPVPHSSQVIPLSQSSSPVTFDPDVRKIRDEPGRQSYRVTAHVGDQVRELTWDVIESRQQFLIARTAVLSVVRTPQPLPVWINDHPISADTTSVHALPGIYEVSSSTKWMSYAGPGSIDLLDRQDVTIDQTIVPALATVQALNDAVLGWLSPCLSTTQPSTDCGWQISASNGQVVPGSVTWTIEGRPPSIDLTTATWEYTGVVWQLSTDLTYTTLCSGSGILADGGEASFSDAANDWGTHVTALMGDTMEVTFVTEARG